MSWGMSRGRWIGLFVLVAGLLLPGGWVLSDRLEEDNDFCNACHLEPGRPLHERIRQGFDARPPVNLASAHGLAGTEARPDGSLRCIDCHGGTGLAGRLRVKALAAKDAFWYVVGHFEEPDSMRWPLRDEDCTKCHADFSPASAGAEPFHSIPVHNARFEVACVECHVAHESGGNPQAYFMDASRLRPLCARCHPEFAEGGT